MNKAGWASISFALAFFASICAENELWYMTGILGIFSLLAFSAVFLKYLDPTDRHYR